jgi:hypothetical protein
MLLLLGVLEFSGAGLVFGLVTRAHPSSFTVPTTYRGLFRRIRARRAEARQPLVVVPVGHRTNWQYWTGLDVVDVGPHPVPPTYFEWAVNEEHLPRA